MTTRPSLAALCAVALVVSACGESGVTNPDIAPQFGVAAGKTKVAVCHASADGSVHLITVGEPAVAAHLGHGDALPGDALPDHGGFVGDDCAPVAIVLNPAATFTSAQFGGGGGGPFVFACPVGTVGVGISGTAGGWTFGPAGVWGVRLQCALLLPDGSVGPAFSVLGAAGDGTSGYAAAPFVGSCAGDLLNEVNGRTPGYVVAGLGGACASAVHLADAVGGSDSTFGPFNGVGFLGSFYAAACPTGYAVTALTGGAGWVLDRAGVQCTQVIKAPL